jgi:hypothetical protein
VDLTVTSKEAGFVIPTALNSAEWEACVRQTRDDDAARTRSRTKLDDFGTCS